ncbi:MAG: bacterial Ig-like domain-containing protein [Eubacteriales bacterium]|nr:bacterial Ig-like domain-containing protein [Eubacteriales bacterium]
MKRKKTFSFCLVFLAFLVFLSSLQSHPMRAMENEAENGGESDGEVVELLILGSPHIYTGELNPKVEINPDNMWPIFKRIENVTLNSSTSYADIRPLIPKPVKTTGWTFLFPTYNHGASQSVFVWSDADIILEKNNGTFPRTYEDSEGNIHRYVEIHFPYTRSNTYAFDARGATFANPEKIQGVFDAIIRPRRPDTAVDPQVTLAARNQEGRDEDVFKYWAYQEINKDNTAFTGRYLKVGDFTTFNIGAYHHRWYKIPGNKELNDTTINNPHYTGPEGIFTETYVIQTPIMFSAIWNEAPLLELKDMEITAGDSFDPKSMIVAVSDREYGSISSDDVTISGDYDINTAGEYTLEFTATDDGKCWDGTATPPLKHKLRAKLTVKAADISESTTEGTTTATTSTSSSTETSTSPTVSTSTSANTAGDETSGDGSNASSSQNGVSLATDPSKSASVSGSSNAGLTVEAPKKTSRLPSTGEASSVGTLIAPILASLSACAFFFSKKRKK